MGKGEDMAKNRYYVGHKSGSKVVFPSAVVPTEKTHGESFNAVIGPFKTKRAALLMARYGYGNPHLQTVQDAERIAAEYATRARA